MAINDEIAAGGRPIQIENPLNNMVKFANIQNDMSNMALHRQKMEAATADMARKNELYNYLGSGGRDPNRIFQLGGDNEMNQIRQAESARLTGKKTEAETDKIHDDNASQALRNISENPSDEVISAYNLVYQLNPNNSAERKTKSQATTDMLLAMPLDQRPAWLASQGASAADLKRQINTTNTGGRSITTSTDPYSGETTEVFSVQNTLTPEQRANTPVEVVDALDARDMAAAGLTPKSTTVNGVTTSPLPDDARAKYDAATTNLRAAQQQARSDKQPLGPAERLIKDYNVMLKTRSPDDPEMKDMRAQIEHYRSFAPPARTDIKVNSYEPASVAAQKDYMSEVSKTRALLRNSKGVIDNIDKAIALIPSSAQFMGTGGEPLLNAAVFLNNRLGLSIDTKGVTSASELRTRMFFNIMDNLRKVDPTPTQKQQDTLQEALGSIGLDPNALPKVLRAFQDVIRSKVEDYNKDVTDAEKRGVKFPFKPQIDLGAYGGRMPPTSAAVEYLKANPSIRAYFEDKFGPGSADEFLDKGK